MAHLKSAHGQGTQVSQKRFHFRILKPKHCVFGRVDINKKLPASQMAAAVLFLIAAASAPISLHAFQHVGGFLRPMQAVRPMASRITMASNGLKGSKFIVGNAGFSPLRAPVQLATQPEHLSLAFPQQRSGRDVSLKTGTLSTGDSSKPQVNRLLLGFYFLAWYVLNVGYNIYVKRTLNVLPLPFTFAVIQLGAGAVWLLPQFLSGIRKVPKPSPSNIKALTTVAAFHGAGQLATVVAMGLGCVCLVWSACQAR
jgi:hypothetical protein